VSRTGLFDTWRVPLALARLPLWPSFIRICLILRCLWTTCRNAAEEENIVRCRGTFGRGDKTSPCAFFSNLCLTSTMSRAFDQKLCQMRRFQAHTRAS